MSHQRITREGILFRTKPLSREHALSFAKALGANKQYRNVLVHPCSMTSVNYFVSYAPVDPERHRRMLKSQQESRDRRAEQEGQHYQWFDDPDNDFTHCLSVSGEVYEVTERGCNCPDYEYRCRTLGIACKHCVALRDRNFRLKRQAERDADPEAYRARMRQEMEEGQFA